MKLVAAVISFVSLVGSNIYFSAGYGSSIYMQDYTYGELVYQLGILFAILNMFIFYRWDIKHWGAKLFLNWCIEIYLIAIFFTCISNPYSMNWDKMLFLEISIGGMLIMYSLCALFPQMRRFII